MGICFSEPTIDELLDDSLTQGLMRADGVDAAALRNMLYGLASSIDSRPSVQHDRISSHGGVLAQNSLAALHGVSTHSAAPVTTRQISNSCVGW